MSLAIDVIIPVHDPERPLRRALESVFAGGLASEQFRVTVVCHNIAVADIQNSLDRENRARVRWLHAIGGRGAGMPFNVGLAAADAEYVSKLDSDDWLQDGALAAWLEFGHRHNLDAVIPPERHAAGSLVRTPPVRRWPLRNRSSLDPLRDRLIYRTAFFGLLRTSALRAEGLVTEPELPTGEDMSFSARLWHSGRRIGYARSLPGYIVGDDAAARTTLTRRRPKDELAAMVGLLSSAWLAGQSVDVLNAVAVKSIRVHLFSCATRLAEPNDWQPGERAELAQIADDIVARAPGCRSSLSLADMRLLNAIRDPGVPNSELRRLSAARRRFASPAALIASAPRGWIAPDGPLRFAAASALLGR